MSPDLTNLTDSLQAAGIQDGEHLIAVAQQGQVSTTKKAFAAWCYGGNCVVAWGPPESGGDSSGIRDQLRNVQQIQATTGGAFSAILADGSVVSWGVPHYGGNCSAVQAQLRNVQQVQAADAGAFAAILADGSVVTWGDKHCGGNSFAVQNELRNVQRVQATDKAFAAILANGSVVAWGSQNNGGDCSEGQDQLRNVQQVQATDFAAKLPPRGRHGHHVWWRKLGRKIRPVCIGPQLHSYAYSCGFALAVVRKQQKSRVILMWQVGFPSFCH